MRNKRKKNNIIDSKETSPNKIFCFFTVGAALTRKNPLLTKKGLLLKERILFFEVSLFFEIDFRENFQKCPGYA